MGSRLALKALLHASQDRLLPTSRSCDENKLYEIGEGEASMELDI
ncbi:hypothetical protein LINPERHAP1_LOCUS19740 [Linum perenne]